MRSVQEVSATKKGRRRREIPPSCSPQKMPLLLPPTWRRRRNCSSFSSFSFFVRRSPPFLIRPPPLAASPHIHGNYHASRFIVVVGKGGERERGEYLPLFPPSPPHAHAKVDWQSRLTPTRKATWGIQQLLFFIYKKDFFLSRLSGNWGEPSCGHWPLDEVTQVGQDLFTRFVTEFDKVFQKFIPRKGQECKEMSLAL